MLGLVLLEFPLLTLGRLVGRSTLGRVVEGRLVGRSTEGLLVGRSTLGRVVEGLLVALVGRSVGLRSVVTLLLVVAGAVLVFGAVLASFGLGETLVGVLPADPFLDP